MHGTQRDVMAGQLLKELRESQGLSREQLPHAMLRAGVRRDCIPSTKTIYNVEERGQVPRVRLKFGFAQFYSKDVVAIWGPPTTQAMRGGPVVPARVAA